MNHTQRALSSSTLGECTPTHKPHCRVQDDGGTTSLASSPGEMDEHDWLLYYGDIFKGRISVILYSRMKIIMYLVYHSISLQKLIHHVGAHQHKALMNQTQLSRSSDYHRMGTIEASNV